MNKKIVTFGEVMLRLSPSDDCSIGQTTQFDACYGGSEANVAHAIASYGAPAKFVSSLPSNSLGEGALYALYNKNLDVENVRFSDKGRLGIYFLETDHKHFSRTCLYDRAGSSFALSKREDYDWEEILKDASVFHFSGITPALSPEMPLICEDACIVALRKRIPISIDINYRSNLWDKKTASAVMRRLSCYADILFINEDEFSLLGVNENANSLLSDPLKFKSAAEKISEYFSVPVVTSVERILMGPAQLGIKAMIYQWTERGFVLRISKTFPASSTDLSGAGDAYAAALLYALHHEKMRAKRAVNFAAAACALKHSYKGDLNSAPLSVIKEHTR